MSCEHSQVKYLGTYVTRIGGYELSKDNTYKCQCGAGWAVPAHMDPR